MSRRIYNQNHLTSLKMARRNPARGVTTSAEPLQVVADVQTSVPTGGAAVDAEKNLEEAREAEELVELEEAQEMSATEESDESNVVAESIDDNESEQEESDSDSDSESESESEGEDLDDAAIEALLSASSKSLATSDPSTSLESVSETFSRLPKLSGDLGVEELTENGLMKEDYFDYGKEDSGSKDKERFSFRVIRDPQEVKLEKKKAKANTAGDKWYGMKAPDMTPQLEMDLKLLKMRNVLDPKRFYKKSDSKKDPKFFEMGTIVEGNTEFFSARMTKKERKQTFAQELLGDDDSQKYFKRKYEEIGDSLEVGRKKHFQNLKDLRKKRR